MKALSRARRPREISLKIHIRQRSGLPPAIPVRATRQAFRVARDPATRVALALRPRLSSAPPHFDGRHRQFALPRTNIWSLHDPAPSRSRTAVLAGSSAARLKLTAGRSDRIHSPQRAALHFRTMPVAFSRRLHSRLTRCPNELLVTMMPPEFQARSGFRVG